VITSAKPLRTFGSVASSSTATMYSGNRDRHLKLWNIVSTEIYIPYAGATKVATYKYKVHKEKIVIIYFIVNFVLSISVCRSM
jgi:hypothetical protein